MTTTHVLLPPAAGVLVSANPGPDLATFGYDESEWTVTGTAPSYAAAPMPRNGQVDVSIRDTAEFTTRVLIRQPEPGGRRSGTLVVEWLNVSSGDDTAPDYTYVAEEIVRRGHVWVGISAQHVGVEGGRATVGDFTEQAATGFASAIRSATRTSPTPATATATASSRRSSAGSPAPAARWPTARSRPGWRSASRNPPSRSPLT